jgi:hypothetical protein
MARFGKLLALSACACVLLASVPAGAATPASATMSKTKKSVSWTGSSDLSSPFYEPFSDTVFFDCNFVADPNCDHFSLKIDLGEGAKIQVTLTAPDPADPDDLAKPYNDFDVYIYQGTSSVPVAMGTEPGNDKFTFIHKARYRNKPYDFAIRPWLIQPGTAYKANVKAITLGK